jgi:predicted nucleotidyltransferase
LPAAALRRYILLCPLQLRSIVVAVKTNSLAPETLAERERAIRIIRAHEADLRALGVARLWLFGSIARGKAGPKSDVDVMIAIPTGRKFSLFDLGEVRVELCELLGREVDVVIEEDLRPAFRRDIASDLIGVL